MFLLLLNVFLKTIRAIFALKLITVGLIMILVYFLFGKPRPLFLLMKPDPYCTCLNFIIPMCLNFIIGPFTDASQKVLIILHGAYLGFEFLE